MESPAKRRRKNDNKTSPLPARSLDFFFAKQNAKAKSGNEDLRSSRASASNGLVEADSTLNDEEFARRLQAEWSAEQETKKPAEPVQQASQTLDSIGSNDGPPNYEANEPPQESNGIAMVLV